MSGIYIHIPYCRKACHYCNFHFSTNLKEKSQLIDALVIELELRKNYLPYETLQSIYFGGGTPGVLEIDELKKIIESIYTHFDVSIEAEVTIEVNPDDMSASYLQALHALGFNRLSIGVQSFFDEDLIYMNRNHDASKAAQCLDLAELVGFNNLNLDLIYGFPLLTNDKWLSNLDRVKSFGITHLSCYAMTVEDKTALAYQVKKNISLPMNPEQQAEQFEILMDWSAANGIEHYEISNFCKPGHRAIHNSNYWKGMPYLGIGPSAHSYDGFTRQWNVSNNHIYAQSILQGIIPFEHESLTPSERINEYIMISLRTLEGIDLKKLFSMMTPDEYEAFLKRANLIEQQNLIYIHTTSIILTRKGKLLADKVCVDLFI